MKKDWKKPGRDVRAASARPRHQPQAGQRPPHAQADSPFRRPAAELAVLYGVHPVREALRMKRRKLLTLFATEAAAARLSAEIAESGVPVQIVDGARLDQQLGRDAVHQGLMLEARPLPALDIADIASDGGTLLVLDQITDPHNVGAILRTAAAFAVRGLVMTDRHAPALDGVLAKSASGALEHVPIASVVNLARALDEIGALGFRRIGLDSDGEADLRRIADPQPVALVLGAEGSGLRRLTRERCDAVARLSLPGAIRSLNVSNACAVALAMLQQDPTH
mgnify:CR=1 FL=1